MNRYLKSLLSVLTFGMSGIFDKDFRSENIQYRNSGEANNILGSLLGRYTGSQMSNSELQASKINLDEAQRAREWSLMMDNTKMQRAVADYQAAGLNPMSLGSNGSVSVPSASVGQAVAPSAMAFNIPSLISSLSQLGVNRAQAKYLNASANLKEVQAVETKTKIDHLIASIEGVNLDNEAKQISNSYLGRMKAAELRVTENEADYYDATVMQIDKSIEKMDYEELEIFMRACDHAEHIQYLIKQESLTDAEVKELNATVKKLNSETRLLNLNIDNFDEMTVVGSQSINFKVGPASAGESRPVTLKDLKARAKHRLVRHSSNQSTTGRNSVYGDGSWD